MTLTEYLANLSEKPNSWNPAWAKSVVDTLAADVSGEYVYDADAYITESLLLSLGIHGKIKTALTSTRPSWAEPYISADDWLSVWPLLTSNKGNVYLKDTLTQALLGLMAAANVITAAEASAVLDSGRRLKKRWEVVGLDRLPSVWDVINTAGWATPGSAE